MILIAIMGSIGASALIIIAFGSIHYCRKRASTRKSAIAADLETGVPQQVENSSSLHANVADGEHESSESDHSSSDADADRSRTPATARGGSVGLGRAVTEPSAQPGAKLNGTYAVDMVLLKSSFTLLQAKLLALQASSFWF